MNKTLPYIYGRTGWRFTFTALSVMAVGLPFVIDGAAAEWALLAALPVYMGLVAVFMGAEMQRRHLRERAAWAAFGFVLHNADQNRLPPKHQDMTAVKSLELDIRKYTFPPGQDAEYIYSQTTGLFHIEKA